MILLLFVVSGALLFLTFSFLPERFWQDNWVNERPLCTIDPELYEICDDKFILVKDARIKNWQLFDGYHFADLLQEGARLLVLLLFVVCASEKLLYFCYDIIEMGDQYVAGWAQHTVKGVAFFTILLQSMLDTGGATTTVAPIILAGWIENNRSKTNHVGTENWDETCMSMSTIYGHYLCFLNLLVTRLISVELTAVRFLVFIWTIQTHDLYFISIVALGQILDIGLTLVAGNKKIILIGVG
ncbi:hypothetical protein ACJX0J_026789 [Zea mays]